MTALSTRGRKAATMVGTATRGRELAKQKDLISLSVAQNALMDDLLLPRLAKASEKATSRVRYAASWLGDADARAGIANLYSKHVLKRGAVSSEEVAVVASATSAIDLLLWATCDAGDVVLTPSPYYGSYKRDVEARADCVLAPFPSDDGVPSVAQLDAAVSPNTKARRPRGSLWRVVSM